MTNHVDKQYKGLIDRISADGVDKVDRTGVGSRSVFGAQMRFDISDGKLPLLTTKKVHTRMIIHELLWMLSGDTNVRYLKENNVNIWDSWVDPETAVYRDLTIDEIQTAVAKERGVGRVVLDHTVTTEELGRLSNDGDVSVFCGLDLTTDPWQSVYRKVFEKEPRTLVAGELPKIYQHQWRHWEDTRMVTFDEAELKEPEGYEVVGEGALFENGHGIDGERAVIHREIDQITNAIEQLKANPDSRRILVSAWNAAEIDEMALPPCHTLFQFWTRELSFEERTVMAKEKGFLIGEDPQGGTDNATLVLDTLEVPRRALSCQLYQRSADIPLGVPFNIVQYTLLAHMVAHVTGMVAEEFIWSGGDCHVYSDQWKALEEQFERDPLESNGAKLWLNPEVTDIDDFSFNDLRIDGYQSHPTVKFPSAAV